MEHKSEITYYPAIAEYPEEDGKPNEDLNTPWGILELCRPGYTLYTLEFQFVYWLTRYIAALGDSKYVEWPPGFLKWLTDADIPISERQRELGKVLIDRMFHLLAENHTAVVWNGRQAILTRAEETKTLHWRLLNLAGLEPKVMIAGVPVYPKSLIELDHLLQQERPERLPLPPRRDVVIRRREIVGPFNWTAVKDRSPFDIRPDISGFLKKLNKAAEYYQDGPPENDVLVLGEKNLQLDAEPGVDSYDGHSAGDSAHETVEASQTYYDLFPLERAAKGVRGMRRKGLTDAQIAEKLGSLFDSLVEIDAKPLWRNPKTGRLEHFEERAIRKRKMKREDLNAADDWTVGKPGKCVYCGARAERYICSRCNWEEEKNNRELTDARIPGREEKANSDTLRNRAWRGRYPLHSISFERPYVFNRDSTVPGMRRHIEYLKDLNPPNPKTIIKGVSDEEIRHCWQRDFVPKPGQTWTEPTPVRGSWSGDKETFIDVIDSPEGVLYRVGKALEPLGARKMRTPVRVAWEILNMYGNPCTRDIPANQPGHFGWIPIGRLLLPYTRENIGKKLGLSPAMMTIAFKILEQSIPNMHLPGPPLRLAVAAMQTALNIESVNHNPPATTTPTHARQIRDCWNTDEVWTRKARGVVFTHHIEIGDRTFLGKDSQSSLEGALYRASRIGGKPISNLKPVKDAPPQSANLNGPEAS